MIIILYFFGSILRQIFSNKYNNMSASISIPSQLNAILISTIGAYPLFNSVYNCSVSRKIELRNTNYISRQHIQIWVIAQTDLSLISHWIKNHWSWNFNGMREQIENWLVIRCCKVCRQSYINQNFAIAISACPAGARLFVPPAPLNI